MAQSDASFNIDQNIGENVQKVITAGRDMHENQHHHYHFPSTSPTNYDNKGEQTTGSLEIRCIGLKMTGLKPWHFGMLIGGGIVLNGYFGFEVLNIIKDLVAAYGSPVVQASCGSLELLIFVKDKKSKQRLLKDLLSNNISSKIKSVVGIVESDIRVEVTCIGAVIATIEEFSKLQKHLRTKQKKMQWKVEHDCKSSLMDMCCTLPIFQNEFRMIVEHIYPKDASDYLECAMQGCELHVSQTEFLHLNKLGFLAKHRNYVDFTKTQQSHPGLQNKVIRIVKSLTKDEAFSSKLWKISDLLRIDPRHFPGDCDWVLRNLSKITKGLMFEKTFEVAKDLLVWMIRLLNNLPRDKAISRIYFVSKLAYRFIFSFDDSIKYRGELANELQFQAKSIKLDYNLNVLHFPMRYINSKDVFMLITSLLKQKSKSALALAIYFAKQLMLNPFFLSRSFEIAYFDSETLRFLDALHQCQNKLRHKQFKLFVDFLNKIISKNSILKFKLDILRKTETENEILGYFPENILMILNFFVYRFDRLCSHVVNTLLKCSEQSYKFSIANKNFFRIQHPRKNVSSLQIASFKIIHLINSQWKPQAVSAVELSKLILQAHFSNNSLETRHEKLENFYFDATNLFKNAELALFEIFKHGQIVLDHPKFTSRSDFAKLHEFLEILSSGKIPLGLYQFLMLRFDIRELIKKVKTAFDPFVEFSQQLEMLIEHTTRSMESSGQLWETGPAQEKLQSFDTSTTEVPGSKPMKTSRWFWFLDKGLTRKEMIGTTEQSSLKFKQVLHDDVSLKKVSKVPAQEKLQSFDTSTTELLGSKPMKRSRRFLDEGLTRKEMIGTTEQSSLKFKQVLHDDVSLKKVSKVPAQEKLQSFDTSTTEVLGSKPMKRSRRFLDEGLTRKEMIGTTEQSSLKFKQVLHDDANLKKVSKESFDLLYPAVKKDEKPA